MTSVDKTIDNQINVWKERIDELKEEINSHPFKFNLGFIFKQDSYHPQYRTIRENEIMQLRQKISKEEEYNLMILRAKQNNELKKMGIDVSSLDLTNKNNQVIVEILSDVSKLTTKTDNKTDINVKHEPVQPIQPIQPIQPVKQIQNHNKSKQNNKKNQQNQNQNQNQNRNQLKQNNLQIQTAQSAQTAQTVHTAHTVQQKQNNNQNKKKKNFKDKIPQTIRNTVWNKYIGPDKKIGKCICCSSEQISFTNFQCGHVQSEKMGGKVTIQNLRPVCGPCNQSMGTQNMEDFMKQYGYKKYANWFGKEEEIN